MENLYSIFIFYKNDKFSLNVDFSTDVIGLYLIVKEKLKIGNFDLLYGDKYLMKNCTKKVVKLTDYMMYPVFHVKLNSKKYSYLENMKEKPLVYTIIIQNCPLNFKIDQFVEKFLKTKNFEAKLDIKIKDNIIYMSFMDSNVAYTLLNYLFEVKSLIPKLNKLDSYMNVDPF